MAQSALFVCVWLVTGSIMQMAELACCHLYQYSLDSVSINRYVVVVVILAWLCLVLSPQLSFSVAFLNWDDVMDIDSTDIQ